MHGRDCETDTKNSCKTESPDLSYHSLVNITDESHKFQSARSESSHHRSFERHLSINEQREG